MKKITTALFILLFSCVLAQAQDPTQAQDPEFPADTLRPAPQIDSSLFGRSIFEMMPDNVTIRQSASVRQAFDNQVLSNAVKQFNGYRIRIYLNSIQSAREESSAALNRFRTLYPEIPSYLSYARPNFRVMVGDFRTRVDAEKALVYIKEDFPSATIVRDKFKYPIL